MPIDEPDIPDWPPEQVFDAICADFETAWNAVAALPNTPGMGRGNFMFTIQAMVPLEWACRLCANNPGVRTALSQALNNVRPKYFTGLPTSISHQRDFHVPESPVPLGSLQPLLWMVFDLVRNGLAHQYQQIVLRLADVPVYVKLGGPNFGQTIAQSRHDGPGNHLAGVDEVGALGIVVKPAWLYLDFKDAVQQAGILTMALQPSWLKRSDPDRRYPGLTAEMVRQALNDAGHKITRLQTSGGGSWTNATVDTPAQSVPGWSDALGSTGGLANLPSDDYSQSSSG